MMRHVSNRSLLLPAFLLTLLVTVPPARGEQAAGGTLVVGDVSGSMKGFAVAGPNRLASLYNLMVTNLPGGNLEALSEKLAPVPGGSPRFFAEAKSYRGDTDVAAALASIQARGRLSVLVTDGMQSEGKYLVVKSHLKQMAAEGWGIWLFAVYMPFDGGFDPEQKVDLDVLLPDIQGCAQADDPNAQVTLRKDPSRRSYVFKGLRPLIIFLFAKDAGEGRSTARNVLRNLNADRQFLADSDPRHEPKVVELAPLAYRGIDGSDAQKVDAADYTELETPSAEARTIRSYTVDGKRLKQVFMPVVWLAEEAPVPQAFEEQAHADAGQTSWLNGAAVEQAYEGQDPRLVSGNVRVEFVSEQSGLRAFFCILPFVSCREERPDALTVTLWTEMRTKPGWWDALSADNSWQCPTRVYKLTELTKEVAAESAGRHTAAHPPKVISIKLVVAPSPSSS